jgi:hypothetical protein
LNLACGATAFSDLIEVFSTVFKAETSLQQLVATVPQWGKFNFAGPFFVEAPLGCD